MPDVDCILRERFARAVAQAFGGSAAEVDPLLRPAANPKFGDYQANLAMSLAKQVGGNPREVAQKIVANLKWEDICAELPGVAGPGFINLKLSPAFLAQQARSLMVDSMLGAARAQPAQTVVVDYSGPNVAKEMHVGHLRSTCIGDALARVLEFLGHRVIRQNHLGDWGTQFGMLIEHLHDQGWDHAGAHTVSDLNQLYQAAKRQFDSDPVFAERARKRVVALQSGDPATLELWRALIEESKRHFNAIYGRMGIGLRDADIRAESSYNPMLPGVAGELEKSGLAQVSDGALCVFPPGFAGPDGKPVPVIVRKSDGGYLYATTDLAAIRHRTRDLAAQRVIYVTDARQRQHFAMVFKVAEQAGWLGGATLEHVAFGTILGPDNKPFKTRSGDTVKLVDLLDEAEDRARKIVEDKNNPELDAADRLKVARAVGIGAIKYADLCNDRVKDYVFDFDRMLAFDGNTAPYLQNAFVRIRSIERKAKAQGLADLPSDAVMVVGQPAERALVLKLMQFGAVIQGVAQSLEPHRLCTYLYELASAYHQFYEQCPVLTAESEAQRTSRRALCALTARMLQTGLDLLGIQTVDMM